VETGLNIGRVINLDGKFLGYFGKKKIGKTKHPTRNIVLPGLRALNKISLTFHCGHAIVKAWQKR